MTPSNLLPLGSGYIQNHLTEARVFNDNQLIDI